MRTIFAPRGRLRCSAARQAWQVLGFLGIVAFAVLVVVQLTSLAVCIYAWSVSLVPVIAGVLLITTIPTDESAWPRQLALPSDCMLHCSLESRVFLVSLFRSWEGSTPASPHACLDATCFPRGFL